MPADAVPELVCPITGQLFEDPVLLVEDGHTYERSAVIAWLERNDTSPMTGAPLARKTLAPNFAVRQMADAARGEELPSDIVRTNEVISPGGANQNVPDTRLCPRGYVGDVEFFGRGVHETTYWQMTGQSTRLRRRGTDCNLTRHRLVV